MKKMAVAAALTFAVTVAGCTERTDRGSLTGDAAITSEVKTSIQQANVPGTIDITTDAGVVTLAGTVPNANARSRAADVARATKGVTHVVNNLRTTMAGDAPLPPAAGAPNRPAAPELK